MYELTINLKDGDKKPLYEQIYAYIKEEIIKGRISRNEKLPSTRVLSKHLQVSRSTVELAYEQLLSEGYIESVPYKGFYAAQIEELIQFMEPQGVIAENKSYSRKKEFSYEFDFSPNGIDLNSFPYNIWRKLSKNVLMDDNKELFQQGLSKGEVWLREAICKYLFQARGVNCDTEQIILGAGNDYLLLLLSRILGSSHIIAMESPTYRHAFDIFKELSYEVVTVNMDKEGINVEELKKVKADIAYVMPSHQFPLGTVMPIKRRMELLAWAGEEKGRYIIEDDYDSEFRYKGKPIPSLQGYDLNNTVIYIGTFSKSIAPAIRVSYMVLPKELLEKYQNGVNNYTCTVSRIDQAIIDCFIREGYFERHLNRMRAIYKAKHDCLLNEMKAMGGQCQIFGENAGLHILAEFKNGLTEQQLIEKAKKEKIKVYGLSEYFISEQIKRESTTVILGYANLSVEEIGKAMGRLKKVWTES